MDKKNATLRNVENLSVYEKEQKFISVGKTDLVFAERKWPFRFTNCKKARS